jgi:hypothetical protein
MCSFSASGGTCISNRAVSHSRRLPAPNDAVAAGTYHQGGSKHRERCWLRGRAAHHAAKGLKGHVPKHGCAQRLPELLSCSHAVELASDVKALLGLGAPPQRVNPQATKCPWALRSIVCQILRRHIGTCLAPGMHPRALRQHWPSVPPCWLQCSESQPAAPQSWMVLQTRGSSVRPLVGSRLPPVF